MLLLPIQFQDTDIKTKPLKSFLVHIYSSLLVNFLVPTLLLHPLLGIAYIICTLPYNIYLHIIYIYIVYITFTFIFIIKDARKLEPIC